MKGFKEDFDKESGLAEMSAVEISLNRAILNYHQENESTDVRMMNRSMCEGYSVAGVRWSKLWSNDGQSGRRACLARLADDELGLLRKEGVSGGAGTG